MRRALERFKSILASPRAALSVVLVSVIVVLPSLTNGLAVDDHFHTMMLAGDPAWSSIAKPWHELFTFFDGDRARNLRIVDLGLSPWWTDLDLTAAFFRPVSAATHALDHALWPSRPWLMHAHSIAWYAALVAAAAWGYRRLLGARPWVAGLAALLYGFDHTHGIPAGWVANRNALVAGALALASLAAYDVSVRGAAGAGRARAWSATSAALFALALGAGEGALAIAGFFAAHAIYLDERPWRAKLTWLAPHAVVGAGWAALYRVGGFGVRGSGMYIEPLREPVQFALAGARHLPMLLGSELGGPTPDLYPFLPAPAKAALIAIALVFVAWSAAAVARVWREAPAARFFTVGSVLAALPACAVFPSGRLMVLPGFGLIGLIAMLGAGVIDGEAWATASGWSRRLVRSFAIWACGGHLILSPLVMQAQLRSLVVVNQMLARLGADLPTAPSPTLKRIVFMNAPDAVFVPYVTLGRGPDGDRGPVRLPARLLLLATGARSLDVRRTDEHTVVVRQEEGFYRSGTELVARSSRVPIAVGMKLVLRDVTVEVLESPDGVPTVASFRFDEPADSDAYLWQRWDGRDLVAVRPPAVGEHVHIAGRLPKVF